MLYGTQIHTRPEVPCRKRRSKLVQPEITRIQFRPFCNRLEVIEEVHLRIAARSGEHQPTGLVGFCLPRLQPPHQFIGDRNLPLLIRLRSPASIWLVCHSHDRMIEINV